MIYRFPGILVLAMFLLDGCGAPSPLQNGQLVEKPLIIGALTTSKLDQITAKNDLEPLPGAARCDVTVAQVVYATSGVQPGEVTTASAAVLIPRGINCPGPYPLIAFARATTLEKAQTNADLTNPSTQLLMTFFAAQGYAVVATDFLGYAKSSYPYHPYTHAATEASSVIDSIRAARAAAPSLNLHLNNKVMISGYSQGGQAAMATQRAIEDVASGEFELVAAATLAGPYNISGALAYGATHPINGVQSIVPFQVNSYQKIYGTIYREPSEVFDSPYDTYITNFFPTLLPTAVADAMLPSGTPEEAQAAMFKSSYLNDLANNSQDPTIIAGQKQNTLDWSPKAPITMCGGSGDPTVNYFINAKVAYETFISRGVANVNLVDVDSKIKAKYGNLDPSVYNLAYHGELEPPFCMQVARQFFDQYK